MNSLKISFVWIEKSSIKNSLFFQIIEKLSKKKIILTKPEVADLVFFGCYPPLSLRLLKKIKNTKSIFNNNFVNKFIENKIFNLIYKRKYKAKTIFYIHEPVDLDFISFIKADYTISYHMGVNRENHLRSNGFIDGCDWSKEGIVKQISSNYHAQSYGKFYDIDQLLIPQGDSFLQKKKCMLF